LTCLCGGFRLGARTFSQSVSIEGTFAQAYGGAEMSASCPANPGNGAREAVKDPGKTGGR